MQLKKNNSMKFLFLFMVFWVCSIYAQKSNDRFSKIKPVTDSSTFNRKAFRKSLKEADEINLHLQDQLIKSLTNEAMMAVDTLNQKQREIIINHYIRIYRTVPIYVPINDSDFSLADTLRDVYLDSIRHIGILKKIFKRKKNV